MKNRLIFFSILVFSLFLVSTSLAVENSQTLQKKVAHDVYKVWTISFNESLDHSTVNNNTVFVKNSFNRNVDINISLSTDGKKISVTPKQMYVPGYEYVLHIENVVSTQNERLSPAVKMPFVIEEVKEEKKKTVKNNTKTTSNEQQTNEKNNTNPSTNLNNNSNTAKKSSTQPTTNTNQQTTSTPKQSTNVQTPVHLKDIKVKVGSLVSNVTLKTSNFVALVKVDGKNMHYLGNNVYELTIPNLKQGDSIKIEAFASYEKGSSLEVKNHVVK